MPVGTFLSQYQYPDPQRPDRRKNTIELVIPSGNGGDGSKTYRDAILAEGGKYGYRECLGDQAVLVVTGVSLALLTQINADPVIRRFPGVNHPNDNLGVLTDVQWTNYRDFAISLGYPGAEWDAAFPLSRDHYTLRDVCVFAVKRRRTGRFDTPTQTVILDGAVVQQSASLIDDIVSDVG